MNDYLKEAERLASSIGAAWPGDLPADGKIQSALASARKEGWDARGAAIEKAVKELPIWPVGWRNEVLKAIRALKLEVK